MIAEKFCPLCGSMHTLLDGRTLICLGCGWTNGGPNKFITKNETTRDIIGLGEELMNRLVMGKEFSEVKKEILNIYRKEAHNRFLNTGCDYVFATVHTFYHICKEKGLSEMCDEALDRNGLLNYFSQDRLKRQYKS